MAARRIKTRKKQAVVDFEPIKKDDLTTLVEHIKENPLLYTVSAVFIFICMLAGTFYRIAKKVEIGEANTALLRAIETTDPALKTAELETLTTRGAIADEALYLMAEAACEAKEYDKAKSAFEELRSKYANSEYAPAAVDGLGFVAEEKGNYQEAIARYKEVMEKWPSTLLGRRAALNVGRCEEQLGNLKEAVTNYQSQLQLFPASNAYREAEAALTRLRTSNPELFPEVSQVTEEQTTPEVKAGEETAAKPETVSSTVPPENPPAPEPEAEKPATAPNPEE